MHPIIIISQEFVPISFAPNHCSHCILCINIPSKKNVYNLDLLGHDAWKKFQTYSPKWWLNGSSPWYNVKLTLDKSKIITSLPQKKKPNVMCNMLPEHMLPYPHILGTSQEFKIHDILPALLE